MKHALTRLGLFGYSVIRSFVLRHFDTEPRLCKMRLYKATPFGLRRHQTAKAFVLQTMKHFSSPLKNGGQTNRTGRRSGAAALAACPPKTLSCHKLRQRKVFGRQNSDPRFERERRFASAHVQNVGLTSIFQRALSQGSRTSLSRPSFELISNPTSNPIAFKELMTCA